jgi:hypothetical protein
MNIINLYIKTFGTIFKYCTDFSDYDDYDDYDDYKYDKYEYSKNKDKKIVNRKIINKKITNGEEYDIENQNKQNISENNLKKRKIKFNDTVEYIGLTDSYENYNTYNKHSEIILMNAYIGCGIDKTNGLEWKRISDYSDFEIIYNKNTYRISYRQIEKILYANENYKKYSLENVLKMYIDCGKNSESTITHLELQ